jgi:outer membrane protein insertion porin family
VRQCHKLHCNNFIPKRRATPLMLLLLMLSGLFAPYYAVGETTAVNVLVLPFEVRAPNEASYLQTQIASVLAEHLERDGATRISLKETDLAEVINNPPDVEGVRQLAQQYKADQVIWGSFTLIGDSYSIDARMTAPAVKTVPDAFTAQGRGLENLLNVLKTLSSKIKRKLFQQEIISEVRVQGNQRIEADAILRGVKTKSNSIYQRGMLSQDLRTIYAMGWFDDVRVEVDSDAGGKTITFHVKEKPVIRRIKLKGNLMFDDEKIKEGLTISTGAILNSQKIRSNIEQIEMMYKEKNYHDIKIDYKLHPLKNNQADIEFIIDEGDKLYITEIQFEGNHAVSDRKLKKIISTSEKGFFSWITSSGDFNRAKLDQDTALIGQFYQNQGYIRARVGDPVIEFQQAGIRITFKIEEGPQFKVGQVDIAGELLDDFDKDAIIKDLKITQTTYFSREKIRDDVTTLKDLYGASGYAYADIKPYTVQDPDKLVVDITFNITKGDEIYFGDITISGNTRTRDKVIRRQLTIHEQERFDGNALKRSVRNLHRLSYFEDIKVDTTKSNDENKMDIKIEVTEQPTGMFSFGAGYSSEENFFLTGEITERNLFGRGQILQFKGTLGASTTQYTLSFTEPWLNDTPLSATISAYDREQKVDNEYDRHTIGGALRFGYPLLDYTRGYLSYAYDVSDITNITDQAPDGIIELEGEHITSSTSVGLAYDSRDNGLNPTEGSKHSASFEYAGLGGDIGFNKYGVETGWYWPLFKNLVGFVHGKYGYVHKNDDDKFLPDYEKFYLGGINSLRGFDYRGVHLNDAITQTSTVTDPGADGIEGTADDIITTTEKTVPIKIGGDYMVQFNFELIFPISRQSGLMGVVFYDTGNVYGDNIDLGDMRESCGFGIRWFSPMAPIRLEYGHKLDPREGEKEGRWEFTMGGAF